MAVAIKMMMLLYAIAFMLMPLSVLISAGTLTFGAFRQFREFAKSPNWPDLRLGLVMLVFAAICFPMAYILGYALYAAFTGKP